MIRRGKVDGWLSLPPDSISLWASLHEIEFNDIHVGPCPGHDDRGLALVASTSIPQGAQQPLLHVPRDLVLSRHLVEVYAKSDKHLREVLAAVCDFGQSARGAILIFLLIQVMTSCPDLEESIGVKTPFTEYIKFLPMELLPTFWTDLEKELLKGTSLAPALDAKMKSLHREYDLLRSCTEFIPWCQKYWWDDLDSLLCFDDWKQLDAIYRSRALEFPGIGDSIVPCIDMANHVSGSRTAALYEADCEGNAVLLLADGRKMEKGEEVTITYGEEKGACEQIFSYGFLEEGLATAKDIFLGLDIPDDDPLRMAKQVFSTCAPGVRVCDSPNGICWESEYIWIICINEEDGLHFTAARTITGDIELNVTWKEQELSSVSKLKPLLQVDKMWEVYQLRAVAIILDRVDLQLLRLHQLPEVIQPQHGEETRNRRRVRDLAAKLRDLEIRLLEKARVELNSEKEQLIQTETVRDYLGLETNGPADEEHDSEPTGIGENNQA